MQSNILKKYIFNTSWMFLEQILRLISGVFVGAWVARFLEPEKYGILSYSLAFVALFQALPKLGLDEIVVRDMTKEDLNPRYLGTIFWIKVLAGIMSLILVTVTAFITESNPVIVLYIIIISAGIIFQSSEVIDFYFQSQVQYKYTSLSRIIQTTISSCLKIYLITIKADLFWFVIVTLIDQIIFSSALVGIFKAKYRNHLIFKFDSLLAREMVQKSLPLLLGGLSVTLYSRIDQIMIKSFIDERSLGIYSAAVRLSEFCNFIPIILASSIFPYLIQKKSSNELDFITKQTQLYSLVIWIALGNALFLTFFSQNIVSILYGVNYLPAINVLKIHCWSIPFIALGVASSKWYIIEDLRFLAFLRTLAGLVTNLTLNFILIPRWGIEGAAISTVVSCFMAGLLFDFFHPRTRISFKMKINALFFRRDKYV